MTAYEARTGQTRDVEDERLRGAQTVAFESAGADEVQVTLTLDYELKERNALTPLLDRLFIRRELTDVAAPHADPLRPRAACRAVATG